MKFVPRMRLNGRRTTEIQILQEISDMIHGTGSRPYPIPITEVAKMLGVSRGTIYSYIKRMKGISKSNTGRFVLPKIPSEKKFRQFNKDHPITSEPLVAEWIDDLITRKGGEPLKNWKVRLRSLESVCNTCVIHPSDLLVSQRNTEKIMRSFAQLCAQKKDTRDPRGNRPNGVKWVVYTRVQAVRDFCGFYNITWRKGVGGIMSQKVLSHGLYADIRLTNIELEQADTFIKERWGIDSDIYRWFWIGIESCARFGALYTMSNDYTTHNTNEKTIYIMNVIESKTVHIRGGKWTKYITKKETQQSIDLLRARGCDKIYESKVSRYAFQIEIREKLIQVYKHLGKNTHYFLRHHTHVLRHIGAHYWLSKTNYNYGIIAEIGGWNTIDELKKSYGQIPPEKILEIIQ